MTDSTLLVIMAGAVIVSAIALMIQAAMLVGMYKSTKVLEQRVLDILPKAEGLIDASKGAVEEGRAAIADFRTKSNAILDTGQEQMKQLQTLMSDASERAARQMAYAEAVVEDTLDRVESTVNLVHKGVLRPIRGVTGVAAGVSAALQFLLNRRSEPRRAALDEEMYI